MFPCLIPLSLAPPKKHFHSMAAAEQAIALFAATKFFKCCFSPSPPSSVSYSTFPSRVSIGSSHHNNHATTTCWSVSAMNGCRGDNYSSRILHPLETIQTRSFPPVSTPEMAMDVLNSAISDLNSNPPAFGSGIIRLQVPIEQQIEAIAWLQIQPHHQQLPRCFFSGRNQSTTISDLPFETTSTNGQQQQHQSSDGRKLVSVAGVGSAVFFQNPNPFSMDDWRCIKRFLSKDCPLIRAYGAIRFDARTSISSEWEGFGSFYFMIPLIEFDELEGSSMLAINIAWDNHELWSWENAVDMLRSKMCQISSIVVKLRKEVPRTFILSNEHLPNKASWDITVNRALEMIKRSSSGLVKVVLARSSRLVTTSDIDPIAWLAFLQVEGQNAYQFCIQPPDAPAFIGNTPEQLFHRNYLSVSSEALAGTRARGKSEALDFQIENNLLGSPKDHLEFTIVRESIRRKLEDICNDVIVEPKKAIRKLPRVQHLYAQLLGRLKHENDEFDILSSLHPSPAVCGFPTESARQFIAENEMFDRGMYAGPVGWFGGRETEFAVGIRSALVEKGLGALLYAGAGIVDGTISSLEWEELELKTSQFTKLIKHERSLSRYEEMDNIMTIN